MLVTLNSRLQVVPDLAASWSFGSDSKTLMLSHAERQLAGRCCAGVSLQVFEANQRGPRMYAAAGYRPDGQRRTEPQSGAPEIRLVKVLAT